MKLYDLIKDLLTSSREMRNSDKVLMWTVWEKLGFIRGGVLTKDSFLMEGCPTPESVTRARRKVQENNPSLQADESVRVAREEKEKEKGTFVYREQVNKKPGHWDFSTGSARWIDD